MTHSNPRMNTVRSLASLAIMTAAGVLSAGPLTPPAGPVTSTGKTLTEVEPRIAINATNTPGDAESIFAITQPGSYYLTGNITGVLNKHGIKITASGVTLDLNGFDLVGSPAMGAYDAVSVTAINLTDITILNGSCRNWGGEGVDLGSSSANSARIEGVNASGNASYGFRTGGGSTLLNCTAKSNSLSGFLIGTNCSLVGCTASDNTGSGFVSSYSAALSNCTAHQNNGGGFSLSASCAISNCTAAFNSTFGFSISNGSHISGCTSLGNSTIGIRATYGCTILNNTCDQNATGIQIINSNNRIEGNHVSNGTLGYDINGTSNLIIRNTSADTTTHWDIVANNIYGPIINRTAPASAAVLGASAANTLGSTDPNANYSY